MNATLFCFLALLTCQSNGLGNDAKDNINPFPILVYYVPSQVSYDSIQSAGITWVMDETGIDRGGTPLHILKRADQYHLNAVVINPLLWKIGSDAKSWNILRNANFESVKPDSLAGFSIQCLPGIQKKGFIIKGIKIETRESISHHLSNKKNNVYLLCFIDSQFSGAIDKSSLQFEFISNKINDNQAETLRLDLNKADNLQIGNQAVYIFQIPTQITDNSGMFDLNLFWSGKYKVKIDKISIANEVSKQLMTHQLDSIIFYQLNIYSGYKSARRFYLGDEILPYQFESYIYVSNFIRSFFQNSQSHTSENITGFTVFYLGYPLNPGIINSLSLSSPNEINIDHYPFSVNTPLPSDPFYENHLHQKIIRTCRTVLNTARSFSKKNNVPFWITVQAHSWNFQDDRNYARRPMIWQREPSVGEIALQVNLAIAYGAKGIGYYKGMSMPTEGSGDGIIGLFTSYNSKYPFIPIRKNKYGEDKWAGLTEINANIQEIGYLLLQLDSDTAFSANTKNTDSESLFKVETFSADNVKDDSAYVEIGIFTHKKNGNKYAYIVNNRTENQHFSYKDGRRLLRIFIRKGIKISSVSGSDKLNKRLSNDDKYDVYEILILPGQGKLFQLIYSK